MEEVALKLIMQTLMDEEMLQKIADLIMELQKAENTVIPALERQLAEVQASIENIVKAIEMGVFTRSTKMRLEELEAEEERIKGDICREQLDSRLITKDQIWYIFDKFRNMDLSMPQQRQKIIDSFLHSIVLYDDRLVISFNYREKEKTLKLDQLVEFIHSNGSDLGSAASPETKKASQTTCFFLFLSTCFVNPNPRRIRWVRSRMLAKRKQFGELFS
jgi:hypothetical protein